MPPDSHPVVALSYEAPSSPAKPALSPMQTFQEKVKDKIRDDIGALLPDEAINELVARVVDEEFFTKRQAPRSPYSSQPPTYLPSKFEEQVIAAVAPMIALRVTEVVAENKAAIIESIDRAVKDGLVKLMVSTVESRIAKAINGTGILNDAIERSFDDFMDKR